jgi:hypothetical protein
MHTDSDAQLREYDSGLPGVKSGQQGQDDEYENRRMKKKLLIRIASDRRVHNGYQRAPDR